MVELKDLFTKYKELLFSEENKRLAIVKAISESLGISLKIEDVVIKNGTVFVNTKQIYKNEILIKKEEILKKIKKEFAKNTLTDIR